MNTLPLRPNVCMLVFNNQMKLFFGEREGSPGVWQFPQGGVGKSPSLEQAVLRELYEELGAEEDSFCIIRQLRATNSYEWEETPGHFEGKWRGQTQTFWLVEYLGEDSDIRLDRFVPEFMNWKWCNTHEVREMAEPVRLTGYMLALREFEDYCTLRSEGLA
ncbi:MAG: NUDIX domain-containing protein [Bdellovibrionales bacterium]|nr:NUDIX domain-containing protein [Bdellovibrionales bacterium]